MSSTQIVVKTTIFKNMSVKFGYINAGRRTSCPELCIQSFPLYTLEAQAHTHERETDERQKVRPTRISPDACDAGLIALPDGDSSSHCEQSLK